jgi:CDP-diacylglycerol---serine O-phosphatidyltransferase
MVRKNIPNALTICNLFCGCLAIVNAFEGDLVWAAYLVGIAAVFDFCDGLAARALKVQSPIGKDLDSLADMVTFGVLPGVVMMMLIRKSLLFQNLDPTMEGLDFSSMALKYSPYCGFVITIFSCIRLALFNNDPRQTDHFIGLPTPANTIFICSLPLMLGLDESFSIQSSNIRLVTTILNTVNLCIVTGFLSLLLVSEFPLFSLKFKNFSWKDNWLKYVFLLLAVLFIAIFNFAGIALTVIAYLVLSFLNNIFLKHEV